MLLLVQGLQISGAADFETQWSGEISEKFQRVLLGSDPQIIPGGQPGDQRDTTEYQNDGVLP